jgi:hypothetical protein
MPLRSLSVRAGVQILLCLCFVRRLFFSSATCSRVGIASGGCLTNPYFVFFFPLGGKKRHMIELSYSFELAIDRDASSPSQLAYPFCFFFSLACRRFLSN